MPASGSLPVVPGVGPWPAPNRSSWRSGAGQSPSVVRGTPRSGVDGPVQRSYMALVWVGRAVLQLEAFASVAVVFALLLLDPAQLLGEAAPHAVRLGVVSKFARVRPVSV